MSSASPERPRSLKRLSQKRTVAPHSPILAAIPGALSPSAACCTICARRTSPAPSFCERVIRASLCASSSLNPRTRSVIATSPAWTRAPCNAPDPEKSYPTCRMHQLARQVMVKSPFRRLWSRHTWLGIKRAQTRKQSKVRNVMATPVSVRPWRSRREFLKSSMGVVAGAYGLSPSFAMAAPVPERFDGSAFKLRAPEPDAKSGGVLRHGMPLRAPHFDIHQAGTIFILGAGACMFDNLIRRDPNDGAKTIIPDLAHSWEIAPDGKTYTFHLREGVQFHDGADLTAEDVKATYDRIRKPPAGISIPRSVLFKAVSEINARDKHTVEFKLSEPRPISFMMSAFASGWNVIVRKKTLEDNNYNMRKLVTYPGTGPFRSVRRVENEVWVMERNPNYWNKGLPYLDGIEFYHVLPFSPEMGSAILSGRVDYVRITDPVTMRKAQSIPGLTAT